MYIYVTRLMCSPLASNFWSTLVLVHMGLIHGVMTSLPWQTGLQSWQSCTIPLVHSVGYKWRSHWDSPSEGLISYMWIQSDSDLTGSINFQGVCVTRLMCSPLASNFWSTPVLVHKGLIHGVMTSLPWQTGLQSWQSCTIPLAHSVGYKYYYWVVELCKIFMAPQVILTWRMPDDTLNSVTGHTDLILSGESSLSKI